MTLPHDPSALRDREYREAYVEDHVKSYIPYQLRAIREKLRLTQKAFAERIGKPQSVVSRLENTEYGKVTVQTLLDIARGLDIALVMKFASFPEFLAAYADLSAETMAVEPYSAGEETSFASLETGAHYERMVAQSAEISSREISSREISIYPPVTKGGGKVFGSVNPTCGGDISLYGGNYQKISYYPSEFIPNPQNAIIASNKGAIRTYGEVT